MMRVAVLAGLVAVAMSAPTWTSQLAAETNAQAVTTELSATTTWTIGLSKGSYGETDIGQSAFNQAFWASEHHIVKRVCSSCSSDYQEMYMRRYTNTSTWDVYDSLKENWFSADNTLNTDFGIFSTYDDAVNRANGWQFCNYDDPGIGFPRDCGVSGAVGNQWNSWTRGGKEVAYYTEAAGHSWTYAPTEDYVRGTYVHNCHCTACHFEIRDSGHEYKPDITSCADECASDINCQTVLHDANKSKCFWYNNTNSRGTEMPVLKQSSTYNVLSAGNEFTCWYKTQDYTHPTNSPTTAQPTTAQPTSLQTSDPTQQAVALDTFDPNTKGDKIQLSGSNRVATSINSFHSWNSVYGTEVVTSGTKEWTLNVTSLHDHTANYWEMVIGVASTNTRGSIVFVANQEGVGYIQENGHKTNVGSSPDHESYGSTYTVGDLIKVTLNVDARTVAFSKNGASEGTAFSSITDGASWRLAVMLGDNEDAVQIVG